MRSLTIIHPNGRGIGSRLSLEVSPSLITEDGYIRMGIFDQKGIDPIRFGDPIEVRLHFATLCKMLQVFRGERESLEDGRGVVIRGNGVATRVQMEHLIDPVCGYRIEVERYDITHRFMLTNAEALGVCTALENVMHLIAFGQ